jgi:glutathione S-transferase
VPLTLVVANKNYSSWSMRSWVLMRGRNIAFSERMLKFESQAWREHIATLSPSELVPVLWESEPGAGFATWDTLAIAERLHELFPGHGIWPSDPHARARARSIAAEMHSGFQALRRAMPMNIRSRYPGKGMSKEVANDIARIGTIWAAAKRPFLLGEFCAADAFMRRSRRVLSPMVWCSTGRRGRIRKRCWIARRSGPGARMLRRKPSSSPRTSHTLSLKIPRDLLVRADQVIE